MKRHIEKLAKEWLLVKKDFNGFAEWTIFTLLEERRRNEILLKDQALTESYINLIKKDDGLKEFKKRFKK